MRNQSNFSKGSVKRISYKGPQNNNQDGLENFENISPRKPEDSSFGQSSDLDNTWSIRKNVAIVRGADHGQTQVPPQATGFYSRYNLRSNSKKDNTNNIGFQDGHVRLGGSSGFSWGNKGDNGYQPSKGSTSQTDYSPAGLNNHKHDSSINTSQKGVSLHAKGQINWKTSSRSNSRSSHSWDDFY